MSTFQPIKAIKDVMHVMTGGGVFTSDIDTSGKDKVQTGTPRNRQRDQEEIDGPLSPGQYGVVEVLVALGPPGTPWDPLGP